MTTLSSARPRGSAQALAALAEPPPPPPPPPSEAPRAPSRLRQLLALLPGHRGAAPPADDAAARAEYTALLALLDALAAARAAAAPAPAAADTAAISAKRRARRIVRLEEALMALARALHNGGCPAWRLQLHLQAAARGLGLPQTAVHVFPHHVTFAFSRFLSAESAGAKTLSVATQPGLDLALLEKADALARRLSAFATTSVAAGANVARNGAGDEAAVAAAAAAQGAAWGAMTRAALTRAALDAAATGPGFFRDESGDTDSDSGEDSDADSDADEEAPAGAESDDEAPTRRLCALRRSGSSAAALFDAAEAEGGPAAALRREVFVDAALDEALPRLRDMEAAPALYGPATQVCAASIAAAGCALCFWGASAADAALSAALGAWVGALGLVFNGSWGRRSGTRRVAGYELCSAVSASFLSRIAAAASRRPMCLAAARLGALQWLLQGWDATAAIMELTHRNAALVGGAHLLVSAVITSLLGFGCDLGDMLADAVRLRAPVVAPDGSTCDGVAPQWQLVAFVPTAAALCVMTNATWRQAGPMMLIAHLAFGLTFLRLVGLAELLTSMLAAAAVGYAANAYANRTGKPAVGGAAIGVFVLVPDGMAALDGVTSVLFGRAAPGMESTLEGLALTAQVLQTSVAIAAGLFIASMLLSPRELATVRHARGPPGAPPASPLAALRAALAAPKRRRRAAYARSRALPLFF